MPNLKYSDFKLLSRKEVSWVLHGLKKVNDLAGEPHQIIQGV